MLNQYAFKRYATSFLLSKVFVNVSDLFDQCIVSQFLITSAQPLPESNDIFLKVLIWKWYVVCFARRWHFNCHNEVHFFLGSNQVLKNSSSIAILCQLWRLQCTLSQRFYFCNLDWRHNTRWKIHQIARIGLVRVTSSDIFISVQSHNKGYLGPKRK